jgi:hemerythrin-like domain-containing protein
MSTVATPNVGADMLRIHSVITRGLGVSIERSGVFAEQGYPDAATQEGFVLYVQTLAAVLSVHHLAEDEVAFPHLRDKLPDEPFDELMAEHRLMEEILEELQAIVEAGAVEAGAGDSLNDLNRALTRLADLWHPHIDKEGRFYDVERMAALMDVDEHVRLGGMLAEHSQGHMQSPQPAGRRARHPGPDDATRGDPATGAGRLERKVGADAAFSAGLAQPNQLLRGACYCSPTSSAPSRYRRKASCS